MHCTLKYQIRFCFQPRGFITEMYDMVKCCPVCSTWHCGCDVICTYT